MAQRMPLTSEASFALQLKNLEDNELLDFWVQTQQIEESLRREYPNIATSTDYERLIVMELQFRSCSRGAQIAY